LDFDDPFLPVHVVPLVTSGGSTSSRNAVMLETHDGASVEVGVVSHNYTLVPNDTVNQVALDVLDRTNLQFKDGGMIFDGKRYRQRWVLPDLSVEPQPGDIVQMAMDVINSYDGSTYFGILFQAQRLVCSNGMMVDFMLGGFKFRHYGQDNFSEDLRLASQSVLGLANRLEPLAHNLNRLLGCMMNRADIQDTFRELNLPKTIQADAFMQMEGDSTWDLYNGITHVLTRKNTHHADNLNRQVSRRMMAA